MQNEDYEWDDEPEVDRMRSRTDHSIQCFMGYGVARILNPETNAGYTYLYWIMCWNYLVIVVILQAAFKKRYNL